MLNKINLFLAKSRRLNFQSSKRLSLLKNVYRNKRCFIVGNGPSLKISDLDKIRENGDLAIASNKIYLAFEETEWRPTIYTVADWCVAENNLDAINQLNLLKLFPNEFRQFFEKSSHGLSVFYNQFVPPDRSEAEYISYFYSDLTKGAFVGETITNLNIQVAAHLGCSEIYLIGVDGSYSIPNSRTSNPHYNEVLVSEGERNHFSENYRVSGETWSIPRISCHEKNYSLCLSELEKRGVVLANASRKTAIAALPRVEFDSLY